MGSLGGGYSINSTSSINILRSNATQAFALGARQNKNINIFILFKVIFEHSSQIMVFQDPVPYS